MLVDKSRLPCIPEQTNVLMVLRKDSMAYTEFLRGKYSIDDTVYIRSLLTNMTSKEHNKLINLDFDSLWTDHWGVGNDHHSHEFEVSKEKFIKLDINVLLENIFGYLEPEWGFPKGRRAHRETDSECAIREFSEETNIPRSSYTLCSNLRLTEVFDGTNGVSYKHVYFIAVLNTELDLSQAMTVVQKREISDIQWKSITECMSLTRPHYSQRAELLKSFEMILQTFEVQDVVNN